MPCTVTSVKKAYLKEWFLLFLLTSGIVVAGGVIMLLFCQCADYIEMGEKTNYSMVISYYVKVGFGLALLAPTCGVIEVHLRNRCVVCGEHGCYPQAPLPFPKAEALKR